MGIFNSIYKLHCKQLLGLVLKNCTVMNMQLRNRNFLSHQKSRKFSKIQKKNLCLNAALTCLLILFSVY